MSRPSQLLLIVGVYGLGVAIAHADGFESSGTLAVGLGALVPVAASIHYANEYADAESDRLTTASGTRTRFSGGSGALSRTGLSRRLALYAGLASLFVGVVVAIAGLLAGWLSAAAVGVLVTITVLGWQYSVGPLALAWRGFGELDNAVLGGLVLPLYGYAVASGRLSSTPLLACLPFTLLVFANLLATQWPDRNADETVGKRTLPVRWSRRRLRAAYLVSSVGCFGLLVGLEGWILPPVVARASFLPFPLILWGAAWFTRRESPFPTVAAMVSLAVVQLVGWGWVAYIP